MSEANKSSLPIFGSLARARFPLLRKLRRADTIEPELLPGTDSLYFTAFGGPLGSV